MLNSPVRRILVVPPVRLLPEDPDIFDIFDTH